MARPKSVARLWFRSNRSAVGSRMLIGDQAAIGPVMLPAPTVCFFMASVGASYRASSNQPLGSGKNQRGCIPVRSVCDHKHVITIEWCFLIDELDLS